MSPLKEAFPILKGIAYLDNASTTQKPIHVIEAVRRYYEEENANIHRGLYPLSIAATARYEETRIKAATFLNAPVDHIIFTSGTTEAINLVAAGWGEDGLDEGDEILLTPTEHHANILPWQEAARRKKAKLIYCALNEDLTINVDDLKSKMGPRTKMLAITHLSNVTGAITPLEEIIPFAKERGILVLVDGAQAAPHLTIDVQALGCDFYTCSGHKMYAPTGTGLLYIKDLSLRPAKLGGDMIEEVTQEESIFVEEEPRRFEAGTPNLAGIAGLGAAIDFLDAQKKARATEHALLLKAWKALEAIPEVTLLGPRPETGKRAPILTFTLHGVPPHDVAQILGENGVCIRAGKHCAHPLHHHLGLEEGTNRASLALYNDESDIDALVAAIKKAIEVFR